MLMTFLSSVWCETGRIQTTKGEEEQLLTQRRQTKMSLWRHDKIQELLWVRDDKIVKERLFFMAKI